MACLNKALKNLTLLNILSGYSFWIWEFALSEKANQDNTVKGFSKTIIICENIPIRSGHNNKIWYQFHALNNFTSE